MGRGRRPRPLLCSPSLDRVWVWGPGPYPGPGQWMGELQGTPSGSSPEGPRVTLDHPAPGRLCGADPGLVSRGLFWAAVSLASGSSKVIPAEMHELRGGQLLHPTGPAGLRERHPSTIPPLSGPPGSRPCGFLPTPSALGPGGQRPERTVALETVSPQDRRHLGGCCIFLPGLDSADRSRVAAPAAQAVLVRTQWPHFVLGNGEPGSGGPQS